MKLPRRVPVTHASKQELRGCSSGEFASCRRSYPIRPSTRSITTKPHIRLPLFTSYKQHHYLHVLLVSIQPYRPPLAFFSLPMAQQDGVEAANAEPPLIRPSFLALSDIVHACIASFLPDGNKRNESRLRVAEASRCSNLPHME